ncbi:unnamed protein product, partial [Mesorhabditis spiculigera]
MINSFQQPVHPTIAFVITVPIKLQSATVEIDWKTLYDEQAVLIHVALDKPKALSWIGIGFSDHGLYNNSDLCVLESNGNFFDHYIDDRHYLQMDLSQDCELVEFTDQGFVFKRRFSTCDPRDYSIEQGTTQFLVVASTYGLAEVTSLLEPAIEKNIGYGQIISMELPVPEITDNSVSTFEITAKNEETTYWCIIQKMPAELQRQKHHAIRLEPIIQAGNEHLVHHMEIFHCLSPKTVDFTGECRDKKRRPDFAKSCSQVIAAWAKGAEAIVYPPETGLPMGGPDTVPYIMVEIHYNNELRTAGVIDSSGFAFTVTSELRQFDAGVLEVGLIYSDVMSIPPGQSAFPLTGICPTSCTKRFPDDGINVFGTQLHAHLTGRKLWTSIYRKGLKIGELNRDNHFSPHWQHIIRLDPPVNIKKGDVLMTTCVHNTIQRAGMTFGGYEITNEMCVNYIHYYPVADIEVCKSAVSNASLHGFFERKNVPSKIKVISEKFASMEWNEENVADLGELYANSPLNMHCLRHDGTPFPDPNLNWENLRRPFPLAAPFDRAAQRVECQAIND